MTTHSVELVVPADCDVEYVGEGTLEGVDGVERGDSLAGETVTVECGSDQYVLGAAREAGVWLPADCQQGWCCSCAGELLEGGLEQTDARRYFAEDREAALHLLCTATPTADCRIRVCQYDAMLDARAAHDLPPGGTHR